MFKAGNIVWLEFVLLPFFRVDRHGRIDFALFVDPEQHGAIKAVMLAQDSRHHGHGLFAAVFLIGGDENDVLAFAGALSAGIDQPFRTVWDGMSESPKTDKKEDDYMKDRELHAKGDNSFMHDSCSFSLDQSACSTQPSIPEGGP